MRDAWTAERIDLLKKLWAEGETATVIAGRLGGLSRSAVLGKIFRLRLGAAAATLTSAPKKIAQTRADQKKRPEAGGDGKNLFCAPFRAGAPPFQQTRSGFA